MFSIKTIGSILGAVLALFSVLVGAAMAQDVIVSAVRLTATQKSTRFEAALSANVGFSATAVERPYRVIIDIADASFDFPTGAGRKAKGLISSFRYGMVEERKSRIVLDVSGPVLIGKSEVVPAKGKKPARLVVEILPTTAENFKVTLADEQKLVDQQITEIQTAALTSAPSPVASQLDPVQYKTIVIDPGHGGMDPGAVSKKKTKEKDVVFAFAVALREALQINQNYKVILTRESDKFLSLEQRVRIAHENKADLFIALHADTVTDADVRGTTLYTVSDKATDAEAEALAQKENRADVIVGMDLANQSKAVSDVLINLAQRESKNQAMFFSKKAVTNLKSFVRFTGKPVRSAAFVVLKSPDVPSVLAELGYLSNVEDEALLISPEWRGRTAEAMAKAVDDYFGPATPKLTSN